MLILMNINNRKFAKIPYFLAYLDRDIVLQFDRSAYIRKKDHLFEIENAQIFI